MADEIPDRGSDDGAENDPPLPPFKLETLGDVGRALAELANDIRGKKCSVQRGHAVGFVLSTLAKHKADVRDSKHKREVAELHDVLIKKKAPRQPTVM